MTRANRFEAVAYTNGFGQVITPGDPVAYVATAHKRTTLGCGVFEGVYQDSKNQIVGVRVGEVPDRKWIYNPDTRQGHWEETTRKAVLPLSRVVKLA